MKSITEASKVAMKKNSKNLNRVEIFVKRFEIIRLRVHLLEKEAFKK